MCLKGGSTLNSFPEGDPDVLSSNPSAFSNRFGDINAEFINVSMARAVGESKGDRGVDGVNFFRSDWIRSDGVSIGSRLFSLLGLLFWQLMLSDGVGGGEGDRLVTGTSFLF